MENPRIMVSALPFCALVQDVTVGMGKAPSQERSKSTTLSFSSQHLLKCSATWNLTTARQGEPFQEII